jgi:pyruvate kinase
MSNIAHAVEQQKEPIQAPAKETLSDHPGTHLAKAAVSCAADLPVQAIITSTRSGGTALHCASYRGQVPIFALSGSAETVRQLSLCYGVYSAQIAVPNTTDVLVKTCIRKLMDENKIESDQLVAFLGGGHIYSHHTNFMQIETPARLLRTATA